MRSGMNTVNRELFFNRIIKCIFFCIYDVLGYCARSFIIDYSGIPTLKNTNFFNSVLIACHRQIRVRVELDRLSVVGTSVLPDQLNLHKEPTR